MITPHFCPLLAADELHRIRDTLVEISFRQPQKAIAPGQVAVLWDGDWCLGSGTIVGAASEHSPRKG